MPYRTSAATRQKVRVNLKLDNSEVAEAIYDFLKKHEKLPANIGKHDLDIRAHGNSNGRKFVNWADISYVDEVLKP